MAIHIIKSDGPPTSSAPELGMHYVDELNNDHWLSVSVGLGAADWIKVGSGTGGGASTFLDLTDTPSNYSGSANQFLKVTPGANGVDFQNSLFVDSTDVPNSYTGDGGKIVKVKATEDGLEFLPEGAASLPPGGATDDILTKNTATDGDASFKPLADQPSFQSLDTKVADNTLNIATNTSDISALDSRVGTNETNIQTNTDNIAQNTGDIASNRTDINTNTSNIDSNDIDITALQNDKEDKANKGIASGYAPLDTSSRVPQVNLPTNIQYKEDKSQALGYPSLDAGARVPKTELPPDTVYTAQLAATELEDLADVDTTTKEDRQSLIWNPTAGDWQADHRVKWENIWQAGTYKTSSMVIDGDWTMIANKETTDRAGILEDGVPSFLFPEVPLWTNTSDAPLISSGMIISFTDPVRIDRIRIWRPDASPNLDYNVLFYDTTDPGNIVFIGNREIPTGPKGWVTLLLPSLPFIFLPGQQVAIELVTTNTVGETQWNGNWTSNDKGDIPGSGIISYEKGNITFVFISKTDADSNDRTSDLAIMGDGDELRVEETGDTSRYWLAQIVGPPIDQGTYFEYDMIPIDNPRDVRNDRAVTVSASINEKTLTAPLVEIANYWDTNSPIYNGGATVQGFRRTDTSSTVIPNSNAYSPDIQGVRLIKSPDWDIVSFSGQAGAGGGGQTTEFFTDLRDTPDQYAGNAGNIAAVSGDETGLIFTDIGAVLTIPQNTTLYIDTVNGSDIADPKLGEIQLPYGTIAAALSFIASQSPSDTNRFTVKVNNGNYTEANPLNIPQFTSVEGIGIERAIITPTADTQPLFILGENSNLVGLEISGKLGPATRLEINPNILVPMANQNTIRDCDILEGNTGIRVIDSPTDNKVHLEINRCTFGEKSNVSIGIENLGLNANIFCANVSLSGDGSVGSIGYKGTSGFILFRTGIIKDFETGISISGTRGTMSGLEVIDCPNGIVSNGSGARIIIDSSVFRAANIAAESAIAGSIGILVSGSDVNFKGNNLSFARYETGLIASDAPKVELFATDIRTSITACNVTDDVIFTWNGGSFSPQLDPDTSGTATLVASGLATTKIIGVDIIEVEKGFILSGDALTFLENLQIYISDTASARCIEATEFCLTYIRSCQFNIIFGSANDFPSATAIDLNGSGFCDIWSCSFFGFLIGVLEQDFFQLYIRGSNIEVTQGEITDSIGVSITDDCTSFQYDNAYICETGFIGDGDSRTVLNNINFSDSETEFQQIGVARLSVYQCQFNEDNVKVENWGFLEGNYQSQKIGSEGLISLSSMKVGVPETGQTTGLGQGTSYTRDMLVFEFNSQTGDFTDVSETARELGGGDVGIPTTDPNSAIYISSGLLDASLDPVLFFGLVLNYTTVPDLGNGDLLAEIFNGSSWQSVDIMQTEGFAPYRQVPGDNLIEEQEFNVRLQDLVSNNWVPSDPVDRGSFSYWLRIRVKSEWINESWARRLEMTIPARQVKSDNKNFVVYLDLSQITEPLFWSNVKADGSDIRIADSTGNSFLSQDLVWIDTGAQTGELYFLLDQITNTADNKFFIYFENPGASAVLPDDDNGRYFVWGDYDAVYHMHNGSYDDATVNALHGTALGTIVANPNGAFGGDVGTSGNNNDAIQFPSGILNNRDNRTTQHECWVTYSGTAKRKATAFHTTGSTNDNFAIAAQNGRAYFDTRGTSRDSGVNIDDGQYHYLVHTYNRGARRVRSYVDGVETNSNSSSSRFQSNSWPPTVLNSGDRDSARWNSGDWVDEIRVTRNIKSAGYIATQFNNQKNPGNFLVQGVTQTPADVTGTPITVAPRWDQIKLWPSCTFINADGFIEFFGDARQIKRAQVSIIDFNNTVGQGLPALGGPTWPSKDYGFGSPFRFAPGVNERITNVVLVNSDADTSSGIRVKIHFVPRGGAAGNILWRVKAGITDGNVELFETQAEAPTSLVNETEGLFNNSITTADLNFDQFANFSLIFPARSFQASFLDRNSLIWFNIERVGTSELDTYTGNADMIAVAAYTTIWRLGDHIRFVETGGILSE